MEFQEFLKQYYCRCYALLKQGYSIAPDHQFYLQNHWDVPPEPCTIDPLMVFLKGRLRKNPFDIYKDTAIYLKLDPITIQEFRKAVNGGATVEWKNTAGGLLTLFGFMIYGLARYISERADYVSGMDTSYSKWRTRLSKEHRDFTVKIQPIHNAIDEHLRG